MKTAQDGGKRSLRSPIFRFSQVPDPKIFTTPPLPRVLLLEPRSKSSLSSCFHGLYRRFLAFSTFLAHVRTGKPSLQAFSMPFSTPRHPQEDWYAEMLNDSERNSAFAQALARCSGAVVDLGAGCGLLSRLAKSAARVTAVEVAPHLARVAREVAPEARQGPRG